MYQGNVMQPHPPPMSFHPQQSNFPNVPALASGPRPPHLQQRPQQSQMAPKVPPNLPPGVSIQQRPKLPPGIQVQRTNSPPALQVYNNSKLDWYALALI